jgi:hypothetical protein
MAKGSKGTAVRLVSRNRELSDTAGRRMNDADREAALVSMTEIAISRVLAARLISAKKIATSASAKSHRISRQGVLRVYGEEVSPQGARGERLKA